MKKYLKVDIFCDTMIFLFVWSFIFILTSGFNIDIEDAVTLNGLSDPGSYFGYSVGISHSDANKWILVGAPRSNDSALPDVPNPGAVFACTFPDQGASTCNKLDIDETPGLDTVRFEGNLVYLKHGRNHSWLGGSLEVMTSGSSDIFATCAFKWYNSYYEEVRANFYNQGFCYEVPLDLNMANVKKIPALTKDSYRTVELPGTNKSVWFYGQGQLGMSLHYTKNTNHLLMGAPGIMDWFGGFVALEGNNAKVMQNSVNSTNIIRPYIGYSSTSGRYFSDGLTYFAFGAPRASMNGLILFFRSTEVQHWLQSASKILEGSENGKDLPANSYFGATLCTMDVNDDGMDDLIVAAPMYSTFVNNAFSDDLEIGLVSVYLGSKTIMDFQAPPQIMKGTQARERFGSAIANLGDINSDSFQDVAIGAPYGNDLRGAIYIYNGYTGGVWPKYSQRIVASDIDNGLRGFGISLSQGRDMNLDDINDIVVGSYLSDQAVVLYGKSVIHAHADFSVVNSRGTPTDVIEVNGEKRESVLVCFRYSDRRCSHLRLNLTITLDIKNGNQARIVFEANNQPFMSHSVKVLNDAFKCIPPAVIKTKSTHDLVSPIELQTDYSVEEILCPGLTIKAAISHFDGANPGDPLLQLNKQLQFKNECPNNYCKTNLQLTAEAKYTNIDGYFVIGNQDLVVDVSIVKEGDASYGSIFYMIYPSYIGYKNVEKLQGETDVTCSLVDSRANDTNVTLDKGEAALSCLFGNPMSNDTEVQFRLFMAVPLTVANDDKSMVLRMHVSTLSEETDPSNNNQTITINLRHNLEAAFTAISTKEQIYVDDGEMLPNMENIYELYNRGPSTLQSARIAVSFPQIQDFEKAYLFLNKTEVKCNKCDVMCSVTDDINTPEIFSYVKGRLVARIFKAKSPLTELQRLDCKQEKCSVFNCLITGVQPKTSAVIYMYHVIEKGIEKYMKDGKSLKLLSTASVWINKTNLISNQTEFAQQLITTIRKRTAVHGELPWWIILVSVLGGILLIALIILLLWKCGFFKRKTRDELQKRKMNDKESGNDSNGVKKRDSYTDSEGGIIDHEIPPANIEKEKF